MADPTPGLVYVATRCIEDDTKRNEAFLAAHERFPGDGWITRGAAYAEFQAEHFEASVDLFSKGTVQLSRAAGELALDEARVRRLLGASYEDVRGLSAYQPALGRLTVVGIAPLPESLAKDPEVRAYDAMAHGRFEEAAAMAPSLTQEAATRLALIVAMSVGAPAGATDGFTALTRRGLDANTAFPALGFAIKRSEDTAALIAAAPKEIRDELEKGGEWLRAVRATLQAPNLDEGGKARRLAELEHFARVSSPMQRGLLRTMAVVCLEDSAPPEWRLEAERLLFPMERPFLGLRGAK